MGALGPPQAGLLHKLYYCRDPTVTRMRPMSPYVRASTEKALHICGAMHNKSGLPDGMGRGENIAQSVDFRRFNFADHESLDQFIPSQG